METIVRDQLDAFTEDHRTYRNKWLGPFVGIGFALCALAIVGFNRYRFLVKRHVL